MGPCCYQQNVAQLVRFLENAFLYGMRNKTELVRCTFGHFMNFIARALLLSSRICTKLGMETRKGEPEEGKILESWDILVLIGVTPDYLRKFYLL